MTDPQLKNLLEETHPTRPGQEARAWASTSEKLFPSVSRSHLPVWSRLLASPRLILPLVALLILAGVDLTLLTGLPSNVSTTQALNPRLQPVSFPAPPKPMPLLPNGTNLLVPNNSL